MLATIESLFCQALTIEFGETRIPSGSQTGKSRECHTGVIGLSGLFPLIPKHIRTHTVRTIISPEIRKPQSLDTWTGKFRLCMNDSNFLVECHSCQSIIDSLFYRLRLIEIDRQ
jgi:hypothetical protein